MDYATMYAGDSELEVLIRKLTSQGWKMFAHEHPVDHARIDVIDTSAKRRANVEYNQGYLYQDGAEIGTCAIYRFWRLHWSIADDVQGSANMIAYQGWPMIGAYREACKKHKINVRETVSHKNEHEFIRSMTRHDFEPNSNGEKFAHFYKGRVQVIRMQFDDGSTLDIENGNHIDIQHYTQKILSYTPGANIPYEYDGEYVLVE
jgi:hypothetical protein